MSSVRARDSANSAEDRFVDLGYAANNQLAWVSAPHFASENGTAYPVEVYTHEPSAPFRLTAVAVTSALSDGTPNLAPGTPVTSVANVYDPVTGRVVQQTTESGDTVTFDWDDANYAVTVTNSVSGDQVTYTHDSYGHLIATTDPYNQVAARVWSQGTDSAGDPLVDQVPSQDPTEATDRTSAATGYFYDSTGRLAQAVRPDAATGFTPRAYNDSSPTSCQRLPDGSFPAPNASTGFTRPGGQAATMNCAGQRFGIETYTYVSAFDSRVDVYTDAAGSKTRYTYGSSSSIPTSVTTGYQSSNPNQPAVVTTVESSNNRVDASATGGVVSCWFYNSFSQVTDEGTLTVAPTQGQTLTQACAAHRTDGKLAKTSYTYTALGLQRTVTKPAPQGTWTYSYYGTGQLKSVADPIAGHAPVTYTYWPTGEPATVTDELGKATTTTVGYNVTNQAACNGGGGNDPDGQPVALPCKIVTTQPPAPAGSTIEISDASGDLRLTVAAGGAKTWRMYGPLARLTKTVDPTGVVTQYLYDAEGRVTATQAGAETGSAGIDAQATTAYDARGRVSSRTTAKNDATKVTTAYAYDQADRVIQEVMAAPDGFFPSRQSDGTFPAPSSAGQNWTLRTTAYGPNGAVEQTALYRNDVAAGPGTQATVVHKYDNGGREICVDTRVTAAGGGDSETHTYAATDYDAVTGKPIRSRTPIQPDAATGKSPATGCTDSPTDTDKWAISASAFNLDDSVSWQQDPVQYKAHPALDTNHVKFRTTFGYDAAGRQTTVQTPNPANPGSATVTARTCYTPRGETAMQIDAANDVTAYTYFDQQGVVGSVTDPTGMTYVSANPCGSTPKTGANLNRGKTTFGYDGRGNRTSRQSWADNLASQLAAETWTYDLADRPTGYASGGATPVLWSIAYSVSSGRLTGKTTTTGDSADASLRRDIEIDAPSGSPISVESNLCGASCATVPNNADHRTIINVAYDPLGRRSSIVDNSPGRAPMAYGFGYDTAGNVTSQVYPDGNINQVSWNLTGQAVKQTYPDGASFRYRYDPRLALQQVDIFSVGVWVPVATETTNPNGQRTKEVLTSANSGSRTWTRNGATDTLDKYTQILTGTTAITTAVTYDKAARVASDCAATGSGGVCQSTDAKRTYAYDDAGQLTTATVTNVATAGAITKWAYTYGNHGNRLTQKITANGSGTTTTNYSWNQNTMAMCTATVGSTTPSCANPTGATTTYSYDRAGRRTAATTPSGTSETYGYDPRGVQNLATTTPAGGSTTTTRNVIDPLGQMLCNNAEQCWTNDPTPQLTGPTTANYWLYWDNTGATGAVPQVLQFMFANADIRWVYSAGRLSQNGAYFSTDYQGSVLSLGGGGTQLSYSPFGEQIGGTAFTGYRGELQTSTTINLRARYYDPRTGTLLTRDPLDGVNGTSTVANAYHYADNDPLNKTDPLGLRPDDDDTFDPPPVPIQMPLECLPGGAYPTLYFPGEFRDVAAEGYNSQPWYSKGDDAVTHAGAWATSVAWTASPVSLWDAGTYLQHYLLGSGNDKNINVDKVLDDVSELRDEVSVRIERSIGDAGCNDPYFDSGWDTFGIEPSMDLNWFLVFHNFQLRVHGFVTSSGSTTTVRYRVAMADVYDFDPAEDDVLPDVLPFSYGDLHGLHTAGLAQNFVAHGQSRERVLTL